jgi:quercetin dioxygenase-like cupin family protein
MRLTNLFLVILVFGIAISASAQEDKSTYVAAATTKFQNFPGLPQCTMASVQRGNPDKGNALLLAKVETKCLIPWHWHTPSESLMMVSGRAKLEMKDGATITLRAGDYILLMAKHVHQFTCESTCTFFDQTGDAPFDIHYVDANGTEITPDQALKPTK